MTNSMGRSLLLVLLLVTLGSLTTAYGQITPSQDAYTNSADLSTNYGTAVTLGVVNSATSIQTTYIQFDLSSIPAGYTSANIAKATLKLYVNAVTTAGNFNVDYVNGKWQEKKITASLAPALGGMIVASVPLTSSNVHDYVLIDVTSAVGAWLNGTQTNDGIALVANSPLSATIDSKESTTQSHPAELDVVYAGIAGVTTASGSGLMGGGNSGTLNLSLTNACAANQVLEWNGTTWICANLSGGGTITGVTAGADLTGGGTSGNVTLNLDTTKVPQLSTANAFTGNQIVNGTVAATSFSTTAADIGSYRSIYVDQAAHNNGSDVLPGLVFGVLYSGISSRQTSGPNQYGLDFWTYASDRMSLTTAGYLGIGTTTPYTELHLRQDNSGGLGPSLTLMNGAGGAGAGASVDFDGYDTTTYSPTARIQSIDDANYSSHLTFQTKTPGSVTNGLVEQMRLSDYGTLIMDSSGNNKGFLNDSQTNGTGLAFGGPGSGEGIASCRANFCPSDADLQSTQYGLSFYTNHTLRVNIENGGSVIIQGNEVVAGCTYWDNGSQQGTCISDARLKTNIQPFPRLLDKLAQLEPVHFDWNPSSPPELHHGSGRQYGFIAQQVEKIFPEMVTMGNDGYRRVNYGVLPYLVLQGLRELKEDNDKLRTEAQAERKKNAQARAEIAKLRQAAASTEARVARLDRGSAQKEAQIVRMSRQIEQLRKAQEQMVVLLARFAPAEGGQGTQSAEVHPADKRQAAQTRDVARAQF